MTPETIAAYQRLRAEHPDAGALTVYRWMKTPKPHALDWSERGMDRHPDASDADDIGTATIEGWDIIATIEEDYDTDANDTYGTLTMRWERGAFANPYFREWHGGARYSARRSSDYAEYHDDICASSHDDDGAARWYIDSSGDSLDDLRAYYRKSGVARHEAYSRALASFRERADDARQAYSDRYGNGRYEFAFVNVTASLAGVEVASASYGGYAWERDYSKPLDPQLDAIVDDAVREVLAEAPLAVDAAALEEERKASRLAERASALRVAYQGIAS